MDRCLITVSAEEDIIAATSMEAPYVEIDEESFQCSFRSFECVNATYITEGNTVPVPRLSKTTLMNVKMTIGKGAQTGKGLGRNIQGRLTPLTIAHKKDRFGLGFKPNE